MGDLAAAVHARRASMEKDNPTKEESEDDDEEPTTTGELEHVDRAKVAAKKVQKGHAWTWRDQWEQKTAHTGSTSQNNVVERIVVE